MLKFTNASISSNRAHIPPSTSLRKREVYAGDTNLTRLKRAPGLLELGGNFLLRQTAEISNTESLNRSVAAKHSQ